MTRPFNERSVEWVDRPRGWFALGAGIACVAVLYVIAGQAGLSLALLHPSASPVWPPTGLALAALLVLGLRLWPGVLIGAFTVNVIQSGHVPSSIGIGIGNTLEAVAGAWLVGRFAGGLAAFTTPGNIVRYVGIEILATLISATIGVGSLVLAGMSQGLNPSAILLTWWVGDMVSALTVAPLLIIWLGSSVPKLTGGRLVEALCVVATTIAASYLAMGGGLPEPYAKYPLAYWTLPPLVWAAFRFGLHGAVTGSAITSTIALAGAFRGYGPFAVSNPNDAFLLLAAFMGVVTLTMLVLAAVVRGRRGAEQALFESQQRLEIALQAGRMGAWEWEIASGRVSWTPGLEAIHGLKPGAFGGTFEDFQRDIHPEDRAQVLASVQRALESGEHHLEYRITRNDGQLAWLQTHGKLVRDQAGQPVRMVGVCADITQRKLAESELARHRDRLEEMVWHRTVELEQSHQRLRMSERLASMGTLVAGLGHDMGNLLLPIRLRLEAIQSHDLPADVADGLVAIRTCTDYLQRLTNGLRLFSTTSSESSGDDATDLNSWWQDAHLLLQNAVPRNVSVEREFAADLPPVCIAPQNLTQAIFNLVQNAGEAMAERGERLVRIVASCDMARSIVSLSVCDNGPGMTDEIRERCFEPFFTTKKRAISTGLGLAIVHGLVQQVDGSIDVDSKPGLGTTVTLKLPIASGRPTPQPNGVSRGLAVVTLQDHRLKAYITTMLRSLAFDVDASEHPSDPGTRLWVTEPHSEQVAAAHAFLDQDARRQVLLCGQALNGSLDSRMVQLQDLKLGTIKRALGTMAASMSSS